METSTSTISAVAGDREPHLARMVTMSAWAAVLTLLGGVVAVRTFIAIMFDPGPHWLVPTVMAVGIVGTVCAGMAFATVRRRMLSWLLLSLASLAVGANLMLLITGL